MRKSLQLQAELTEEFGACVFDVTLDCEDGAPVGGEAEHAALVTELALGAAPQARVAVRVHPVDHASFDADVAKIAGLAGQRLCHLMVPKVESVADVDRAVAALDAAGASALPLHVLIESPARFAWRDYTGRRLSLAAPLRSVLAEEALLPAAFSLEAYRSHRYGRLRFR